MSDRQDGGVGTEWAEVNFKSSNRLILIRGYTDNKIQFDKRKPKDD